MKNVIYRCKRWFALQQFCAKATQTLIEKIADGCLHEKKTIPELDALTALVVIFADFDFWDDGQLGRALGVGVRYRDSDYIRMLGNEFYQPRFYENDENFIACFDAYHAYKSAPALRLVEKRPKL